MVWDTSGCRRQMEVLGFPLLSDSAPEDRTAS